MIKPAQTDTKRIPFDVYDNVEDQIHSVTKMPWFGKEQLSRAEFRMRVSALMSIYYRLPSDVSLEKYLRFLWDLHSHIITGRHKFTLSDGLLTQLLATEFKSLTCSMLKLPYPSISVNLKKLNLSIGDGVVETVQIQDDDIHKYFDDDVKGGAKVLSISIYISRPEIKVEHGANSVPYGIISIPMELNDDSDLFDELELMMTSNVHRKSEKLTENVDDIIREIFNVVLAFILYINSESVYMTKVNARVHDKAKDSKYPCCRFGDNVIIDKKLYAGAGGSSIRDYINHTLKWSVRGHFRNQVFGEGRKQTKLIWIKPFLKGREKENENVQGKHTNYNVK